MRKRTVVGRIYGMEYSWKDHKDRNRHKNRIKRSGQARLVHVIDRNHNIPTTWRWARGDHLCKAVGLNIIGLYRAVGVSKGPLRGGSKGVINFPWIFRQCEVYSLEETSGVHWIVSCSWEKILHFKLGTQCFWKEEIFFWRFVSRSDTPTFRK